MGDPVRRALVAWIGACAALALAGARATAQAQASAGAGPELEYQAKALLLLRIAQFTDWPANLRRSSQEFVIGVLGGDAFGQVLDQAFEGVRIGDRTVVIRRFDEPEQVDGVDLLFLAESEHDAADRALARVADSHTLTVADFAGFVGQGGAVELFMDDGHARFRVDRRAAESAGLGLRAQLLRAAASVE